MKVSLLTIGNELLKGATVNTNASWIGKNLFQAGALLVNQLTVQDDDSAIQSALNHLFNNKPDVIIITGGLGPTADDITRETLFNYFGARAIFDQKYWNSLSEYSKFINRAYLSTNVTLTKPVGPFLCLETIISPRPSSSSFFE